VDNDDLKEVSQVCLALVVVIVVVVCEDEIKGPYYIVVAVFDNLI
jgi:hypothetical protein